MKPLLVEFGAGGNRLSGWISHDMEADITKPLPYESGTVDKIRAEHVCEHVTGPEFLRFLDECYRILKPKGVLRLCMPVLMRLDNQKARDIILNHGHLAAYTPELMFLYVRAAGFSEQKVVDRDETDGHWKIIGKELDDLETNRIEATK